MGLSHRQLALAKERFDARLAERYTQLRRTREDIHEKAALQGVSRSSAVTHALFDRAVSEIRIIALLAWNDLQYVLSQLGATLVYADDLKRAVREFIQPAVEEINGIYTQTAFAMPGDKPDLLREVEPVLRPVFADIDIFTAALAIERREPASQINFYAPVQTVVTGPEAAVTVQYVTDNRARIIELLTRVEAIAAESREPDAKNAADLASDIKAEVERDRINPLKLPDMLRALSSAVQTVGSLRPAYDLLTSMLAALHLG
jgi:hypothetical protein